MERIEKNKLDRYYYAKEQVEKMKGFYIHLAIYCIFIFVFIALNIWTTSFPWAIFPIVGWGLGILGHAMETFGVNPFLGKDWERRKIKELMDKDQSFFQ